MSSDANNNPQRPSSGGASSAQSSSAQSTNSNSSQQRSSSLFGLRNRQQSTPLPQWTIAPLASSAARFDLKGLGDPFHRLLGLPLNSEFGEASRVVAALQEDSELREKLILRLDEFWSAYAFSGAVLLYPWEDSVRRAYSEPTHPQPILRKPADDAEAEPSPDPLDEELDEEWEPSSPFGPQRKQRECMRAIDLALVFNVLGRARGAVLVADTPLALEAGFLDRVVVVDDDRVIAMVKATGYLEEVW